MSLGGSDAYPLDGIGDADLGSDVVLNEELHAL